MSSAPARALQPVTAVSPPSPDRAVSPLANGSIQVIHKNSPKRAGPLGCFNRYAELPRITSNERTCVGPTVTIRNWV